MHYGPLACGVQGTVSQEMPGCRDRDPQADYGAMEAAVLSTTDKMLFLKRVSLFSGMTLEQVRVLTTHLEEQHFLPGEVILYEGDFSQELYMLVSGQVRIVKDYGGPHERTLAMLTQGDFFGEMAIFESAPRSATAVTEEESELLVLSPEKFKQTIYQKPEMAFEIFRELSARLRRREERAAGGRSQEGGLAAGA